MTGPKISVLMPAYNHDRYIARAIGSVLSQSFNDFELIVVDDASTDNTLEVAHAIPDSRVSVYSNAVNKGDGGTRNECLKAARAPLIAWMDSDDVSLPTRLEEQFRFLQANPSIDVVGGAAIPTNSDGKPNGRPIPAHRSPSAIRWAHLFGSPLVHGTTMIRSSVYDRFGGYVDDIPIGSDNELLLRCSEHVQMAGLSTVLLMYRRHTSNITDTSLADSIAYSATLTQNALSRLLEREIETRVAALLRAPRATTADDVAAGRVLEAQHIFELSATRFDATVAYNRPAQREVNADRSIRRLSLWVSALRRGGVPALMQRKLLHPSPQDPGRATTAIALRRWRGFIRARQLKKALPC